MAYFRCSLGGGSGNGAVITVAYGAEFYNQTLTATNGTDTVSVIATSSGTVDIDVPSEGSWVISCTIGADTYTSDPVAVDLSYETTLTALPDGKTVLPTDDIETWLKCAGITDKAYTLLSEVLADTDTYVTLLGDSNACDYMARSTTWASTIVADADAMRLLGMYDYACYVLRQDNTWNTAINNSAYASYIPASPTGQTDIIHSAPVDTIYYLDNGTPTTLCVTDANGVGTVDWSDLPTGDITLYSSVAKDPTDLTADYRKTIKVTKNKVEGYLMPDTGVLYWWGYESADLEDCNTANGWSRSSFTLYTPTRNANSLTCSTVINYGVSMIANKNTVDIGTKVNAIWKGTHAYNSTYGYIVEYPAKTMGTATDYYTLESTSVLHTTYTMVTNAYPTVGCNAQAGGTGNYRECELYAVWLEQEVNNGNYTRVRKQA